jgi:hypothetical protein
VSTWVAVACARPSVSHISSTFLPFPSAFLRSHRSIILFHGVIFLGVLGLFARTFNNKTHFQRHHLQGWLRAKPRWPVCQQEGGGTEGPK